MTFAVKPSYWLPLVLGAGIGMIAAQEPHAPTGNPAPAAGHGANAAPAAPAARPPGQPDFKTMIRDFMAIGAPPDPEAVKRGQASYVANCGFCHGTNATGGAQGPDLVRSVLVLHDQGTGKEIGPVIQNGRPEKGMPKFNMTDAQIKDIAAFFLSKSQAAANRMEYTIQNIVTGDPKQGQGYFAAHCASCHSPSGDLAHIGKKYQPVDLQSRFLYPEVRRWPGMPAGGPSKGDRTVTVTLPNGQSWSGRVTHLDDFTVSARDASGENHSAFIEEGVKVEVHDPLHEHAELLKQYSNQDMHNILAYLETLK